MVECVIAQIAIGPHEALLNLTAPYHADYAHRHRCGYVNSCEKRTNLPASWEKIPELRMLMEDWPPETLCVMLDADTVVRKPAVNPRSALSLDADIGLVFNDALDTFNCGVIFARNRPAVRDFFAKVWEKGPAAEFPAEWWEQGRIHAELEPWKIGRHLAIDEVMELAGVRVQRLDPKWNAYKWVRCGAPVIQAFHGEGIAAALVGVRAALPAAHGGWGADQ